MNYRHAYHAGNFADVVKHAILTRIVEYLKRKEKPFRVIDTHAGIGLYDLSSEEAQKTGEWRGGIGRLVEASLNEKTSSLLNPLLKAVEKENHGPGIQHYPGSPRLVRHLLRKQDRLTAIELHPQDAARLKEIFAGDFQARVIELDGWLALGAHLPPKEKRGLVLIDPPFEEEGEFGRIVEKVQKAYRRWPGGIYAIWYPIKNHDSVRIFRELFAESDIADVIDIRLELRAPSDEPRLDGTGMIVVNSPFVLREEMEALLPVLVDILGEEGKGRWAFERLTDE
ncbi:23S rRNA (adenine(2030)-N(6))-methyltransferase RlmJ [Nitratireductor kimnyeongensis]|uniref:Ribosomal RNA large subunit methyltransferase J n=1 Tax=Nitratireductor kimnyeongensis TaxID=430679 RepID=A0ABW0T4I8_9HYPH|nr:23S rRNA (adenine(2030)-N(6))-methyltransferase RlmJ [Nitratireductor kimnyeongensis]QZZ35139.1 23S rRNA (adenine(2030)-N(6))-methyltransferase RlmJ [Nitratireductor kimnyeongensis]